MLPLPFLLTDSLALADWVEISSITSRGGRCSVGDLGRQLKKSSAVDDDQVDFDSMEADVLTELRVRAAAAGKGYPFSIEGSKVLLKSSFEDFLPYSFCLCLSYFGDSKRHGTRLYPRRTFEGVSTLAAGNYLKGEGVRFGAPRNTLPSKFDEAINKLCILIGEGGGFRQRGIRKGQDDTLDVVAWKDSPDRKPGKLLLFGQCASGKNWDFKLSELQPRDFCQVWFVDQPINIVKAFFIPHRINSATWTTTSMRAGIIFDRCRIAYWAQGTRQIPQERECIRWCRKVLRRGSN